MFKESVEALVSHLENLITAKTIVGEPIKVDNATIIPIITTSFGFGTGAGEGTEPSKSGSGKGSGGGAGAKVSPTALVVIKDGDVNVYSLGQKGTIEKFAGILPEVLAKFNKEQTKTE